MIHIAQRSIAGRVCVDINSYYQLHHHVLPCPSKKGEASKVYSFFFFFLPSLWTMRRAYITCMPVVKANSSWDMSSYCYRGHCPFCVIKRPFSVYLFKLSAALFIYFSSASSGLAKSCSFSSAVISSALHNLW